MDKRAALLIAFLLSILHALLAITASSQKSATFDEPTHLTAGYSFCLTNDFRLDPENGTLSARWQALPLLAMHLNFPRGSMAWAHSDQGEVAREFFYHSGNDADALLNAARAMNAILSAALCLLIFFCSREIFGPIGALISESVAVFDPNLLAHGGLATSDTAAALLFLAAVWSYWRMLRCLTTRSFAICALAVAGLFLVKMSAGLFLVVAPILAIAHIIISFRQDRQSHLGAAAGSTVAVGAIVVIAIWTAFGFRFAAFPDDVPARETWDYKWNRMLANKTPPQEIIAFARDHRLFPEAYLFGLAYTLKTSQARPSFLDAEWSNVGFRQFFPRAFLYKTPLTLFLLLIVASVAAFIRWRDQREKFTCALVRLAPILVLGGVYTGFALTSKLNIGYRHLLPIFPLLFIACGMCAWLLQARSRRVIALLIGVAISAEAAESLVCFPNYLAYFNSIAGGSPNGYRHLVDSSLDWGQDLPALHAWLEENVGARAPVYLAYFGTAEPERYGIQATTLPEAAPNESPLRSGIYCISATILQQVYGPERGHWNSTYEETYQSGLAWRSGYRKIDNSPNESLDHIRADVFRRLQLARLCAFLRHHEPLDEIGYSIVVYRVTANDLHTALLGAPPE